MMKVKRTGIANYMPDGEANMKIMVIGGPGVGKTRWASGWPEPIYLDVEAGLASVADLNVPYIEIGKDESASEDMLAALRWLKSHPDAQGYGTVIVDTLDAFQRKVKQEWLDANPNEPAFTGYDAWGFLDSKMQMLMTRLLSLPMNVIVLVHYKDKTITEKEGGSSVERTIYSLQLQGSAKDEVFNDFDLIGWMGSYWKPGEEGGREEARGLTFQPTPQKPFLKDRLHITPTYLEVSLESEDLYDNYAALFKRFTDRLDELEEGEDVGEVEKVDDHGVPLGDSPESVGPLKGGAVAPQDPKDMPLDELTKAELIKMGRGMPSIADEVKTSLLKAELVELVERGRKAEASSASAEEAPEEAPEEDPEPEEEAPAASTDVDEDEVDDDAPEAADEPEEEEEDEPEQEDQSTEQEVDSEQEAAETNGDGGDEGGTGTDDVLTCEECGKPLDGENQDYVRLGYIKYREHLCNKHYLERRKG